MTKCLNKWFLVFCIIQAFLLLSCSTNGKKKVSDFLNPETNTFPEKGSNDQIKQTQDSLYAILCNRVNYNPTYVEVVKFITDSVLLDYRNTSNVISSESFFLNPLQFIEKININNKILIIIQMDFQHKIIYLLFDTKNNLLDYKYSSSYKESVKSRKKVIWSEKESVKEIREVGGQDFIGLMDYIYTVDNKLNLVFSIERKSLLCIYFNEKFNGQFIIRNYEKIDETNFLINEKTGNCECVDQLEKIKFQKKYCETIYKVTEEQLLSKYGDTFWSD